MSNTNIKFDISIKDDKIVVHVSNTSLPVTVVTNRENLLHKNNYIIRNDIFDYDDIESILNNYIWYRGFIGLYNREYGRLFKELKNFDRDAISKFGSIQHIFSMLDLDSDNGSANFRKFIALQRTIFNKPNVYNCIELIGLCGMIAEQWKKTNRSLNWYIVIEELLKVINFDMCDKIKSILQERLAYEELY